MGCSDVLWGVADIFKWCFCCPCTVAWHCYDNSLMGERHSENRRYKRYEKRQRKNTVPPVSKRRKRALTSVSVFPKGSYTQEQSILFKLPPELRIMVYERCFTQNEIWIASTYSSQHNCVKLLSATGYGLDTCFEHNSSIEVLPLLQTCRRIYSESISLLYSAPLFNFIQIESFLCFYLSILPQRANSIQSINIDFKRSNITREQLRELPATIQYWGNPERIIDYGLLKSQSLVLNTMPKIHWKDSPTRLNVSADLLQKMSGLRYLRVMIAYDSLQRPYSNLWGTKTDVLAWLEPLKKKMIDIDLYGAELKPHDQHSEYREIWSWRHKSPEMGWKITKGDVMPLEAVDIS